MRTQCLASIEWPDAVNYLFRCWFPVAWTKDLPKRKPLAFTVLGQQYVAFRSVSQVTVLEDRCPHRGVRLSCGRILDGSLECPYHGWTFGTNGECIYIPSEHENETVTRRKARVQSFPVREIGEMIWFCPSRDPVGEPIPWQFPDQRGFLTVEDFDCSYLKILANLVDNPHAGVLHRWLLRSKPKNEVTAVVTDSSSTVLIKTYGETSQGSILYRVFGNRNMTLDHSEEFVAPTVVRTLFAHSKLGSAASSQFVCTPIDEHRTRIHYRNTLQVPGLGSALGPLFISVVRKIIRQDKYILEEEERCSANSSPKQQPISTMADTPSLHVISHAKFFAAQGPRLDHPTKEITIKYWL
jgi:phenylpropionate dioxygenase-like ring-hydroxylating dioxygenase large terminal subunit